MSHVKICPNCGSTDIKILNAGLDIKMTIKDQCNECGDMGNFPEVEETQVDEFKKIIKND